MRSSRSASSASKTVCCRLCLITAGIERGNSQACLARLTTDQATRFKASKPSLIFMLLWSRSSRGSPKPIDSPACFSTPAILAGQPTRSYGVKPYQEVTGAGAWFGRLTGASPKRSDSSDLILHLISYLSENGLVRRSVRQSARLSLRTAVQTTEHSKVHGTEAVGPSKAITLLVRRISFATCSFPCRSVKFRGSNAFLRLKNAKATKPPHLSCRTSSPSRTRALRLGEQEQENLPFGEVDLKSRIERIVNGLS